ncbi:MAG: DUF4329 domain-containing protein [Bacteroidales bacterium]|nr:DUF4329 domain-containing protein [Bacteroidales bacterium]MCM1148126.1 DUF4329 domain-containing protein [Bacteroidales bacterium]MCM1206542.1 DUF4329 domain-containing protein [Bacillota bacterium]MCM1510556.1 DUF4329 domain-containing protein [Clostridium sp.]
MTRNRQYNGGHVTFTNKKPVYHFCLSDHQGNVRVVADANGNAEQMNHYYPFGALFGESTGKDVHRYKYNGKELDRLLAIDWYDYGARWYDPVLARWHAIDPMSEEYSGVTPFGYCLNNAVRWVDIKGLHPGDKFFTPDAAAFNFGMIFNYSSIKNGVEKSSLIYSYTDDSGKTWYSYNEPNTGTKDSVRPNTKIPKGSKAYAIIHTHADYSKEYYNSQFSDADIRACKAVNISGYLCSPDGTMKKYHRKSDETYEHITFRQMRLPSDASDPQNNGYTTEKIDREFEQLSFWDQLMYWRKQENMLDEKSKELILRNNY